MTQFVFATGQYESGDWDAAPLVPANLIDSVARYTSLDVAPVGAVGPVRATSGLVWDLVFAALIVVPPVRAGAVETLLCVDAVPDGW